MWYPYPSPTSPRCSSPQLNLLHRPPPASLGVPFPCVPGRAKVPVGNSPPPFSPPLVFQPNYELPSLGPVTPFPFSCICCHVSLVAVRLPFPGNPLRNFSGPKSLCPPTHLVLYFEPRKVCACMVFPPLLVQTSRKRVRRFLSGILSVTNEVLFLFHTSARRLSSHTPDSQLDGGSTFLPAPGSSFQADGMSAPI